MISRLVSSGRCRVFLGLIALAVVSYLATRALFGGKDFIFMQDTFLALKHSFLSEKVFYIWKELPAPGLAYISNGYLFYYFFEKLLASAGVGLSLMEKAYIFILIFSTAASFFYVIISVLNENNRSVVISAILGALFYTFNIYTLSLNWFLIENWTAYAILFPLLFFVTYKVTVRKNNYLIPAFIFILVSQLFLYGISGPFLITSLFFVIAFSIVYNMLIKVKMKNLVKESLILICIVLIAALPCIMGSELITGMALPKSELSNPELHTFMEYVNKGSSLSNVFALSGFIWLHSVPGLYPWYSDTFLKLTVKILTITSASFFFYYCAIIRKHQAFYISLAVTAILTIFVMKGIQPPFGELTFFLVGTRFIPFLVLINPYYFFGQILTFFYPFVLSLAFYRTLEKPSRL